MNIPSSRIEREAEFLLRLGSAANAIASIINDDMTREDCGEKPRLNNFLVGGLMDALAILGDESGARAEGLQKLAREVKS